MKYFSDNEQGMPPRTLTEINVAIWNGIVLIINEFIANSSLAASFPERFMTQEKFADVMKQH